MHETMTWTTHENGSQTAVPSTEFWDAWRADKEAVKANGYSVSKPDSGWQVRFVNLKEGVVSSRSLDSDIDVPAPYGLSYFGYQKAGIEFISAKNALLADEPGLGKTVEVAGVINMNPEYRNILIISPNSLKINWKRELEKWLVNEYTIGIVNRNDYPENTDIVIINYDVADKHKEKLHAREWDLLVADEAHALKNADAKRTKAILGKGKRIKGITAKHKLFLTGTPILNRPIEAFTLLNALDPENWGSQWKYAHRYCGAVHNGYGWDFSGASNLEELNMKLRGTIMIRRTKAEALPELPPVFHQVIELPSTAELRRLMKEENKTWGGKQDIMDRLRAAVEIAKVSENEDDYKEAVRNLRSGMAESFAEMSKIRQDIAIAKIPYVIEHLSDVEGKVIVFFHHREVGFQLKEALGDNAVMVMGGDSVEDRQDAVDRFQNDPAVKYFLGSITAAGVGLTLTASSHVVFVELDYRPAMMNQAYSRAQRIGQKNNVLVQYLLVEDSLDVKMAHDLIRKQEIIDKALDELIEDVPLPDTTSVALPPRSEIKVEEIDDEEKADLLAKIRLLASLDRDGARALNNVGFSKVDTHIGHSLAEFPRLSNRQAMLARKLVQKYSRQIEEFY